MTRRRASLMILIGLALILSLPAWSSASYREIALEAASQLESLPGVGILVTLVTPETYWYYLRDESAGDEEASLEFDSRWPLESGRGLRFDIYVSSDNEPITIDWRAVLLKINDGPYRSPSRVEMPSAITPGQPKLGTLWFPFTWEEWTQVNELTLYPPLILPGIPSPVFFWRLPLDFPD